jgi:hypothetical protein
MNDRTTEKDRSAQRGKNQQIGPSEDERMMKRKAGWLVFGAVVVPLLIVSAYLYLSRSPTAWFTSTSDLIGLGVSLAAGAAFLLRLPVAFWTRALAVVLYVPTMGIALASYSMLFVGSVFNDWL